MVSGLLEGYRQYAEQHPEADYSNIGSDLLTYLKTDEGKKILTDHIMEILEANGGLTVSEEQIENLFREVLAGYQIYAQANGYTDPDKFDEYLLEYLKTDEAQAILSRWGNEIFEANSDFTVTEDQLLDLASDIAAGYQGYAQANGLPDP